jgi:GNAT superfamily N-acetyltransferase
VDTALTGEPLFRFADKPGRREGARIFAQAMGRRSPAVEDYLYDFANLLSQAGLGNFVVAEYQGKAVGYGGLITYVSLGWIGYMGTLPDWQAKGIGKGMMRRLMDLAAEKRIQTLKLDATDTGVKLYSKSGFEAEYAARRFEIQARCVPAGRKGAGVRLEAILPDWCLAMDLEAFGDDRSSLLKAVLQDGGKMLLVERRGFGLVHGKKLGPVVADGLDVAMDILWRAASLGATVIYVPLHRQMPEEFLANLKESEPEGSVRCCTRMSFGQALHDDASKVFAAYSAATG